LFAIIDIETTENSYKHGQITEIAIFQHNGKEVTDSYSSLIKPDMDIPLFITRLTGISNEMVKNAPRFYEIARKVVEMTAGRIFVAHNVHFDYKFVREEFKRLGYDFNRKTLCTVQLSKKLMPGHKSYSLGNLCQEKGIEINGRHRAAGDALATVKLFELLLKENEVRNKSEAQNNLRLL
jgi:DNA polymerase III subunit epsilon